MFGFSPAWLGAYVLLLAMIVSGMLYARQRALAIYGSSEARQQWEAWRQEAKKLAEEAGPVSRRVPQTDEPPALVLMRDYFGVCLAGALVLASVLFGTFMLLARGALQSGSLPPDSKAGQISRVGQANGGPRRPAS